MGCKNILRYRFLHYDISLLPFLWKLVNFEMCLLFWVLFYIR